MNRRLAVIAFALGVPFAHAQPPAAFAPPVRFAAIDIYVQSNEPLAAWQFELTDTTGSMAVVGVENGAAEAFANAPHYDLDAIQADRADRIIVADYSLADADELPRGRVRVATVHVRLTGAREPEFHLELIAAGNTEGQPIPAAAEYELQNGRAP